MELDIFLFKIINGYAKKSRLLDFLGILFARYIGYGMIAWLLYVSHETGVLNIFLVPMATGAISIIVINEIVYLFYKRKRPLELFPENVLIERPISPAFPSSHTSFFFAFSFALFLYNIELAFIFLILSFFISLARIFCGVHWPLDIVGGIFSAVASFLIMYFVKTIII